MVFSLKNNGSWDKEILADILMNSVLAITLIVAIWKTEWIWVIGCIFGLLILLVPLLLHRYRNDLIPWPVDVLVATICLLNMFGVLLEGYYSIPFFSEFTQLMVSILVAFLAFAFVYILDRYWDGLKMDTSAMVYVVVVTTMAAMMIFEAIKYIGVFGMRSTSVEMMLTSMFVGTAGGVVMGLFCMWLINKGKFQPLFKIMGEEINEKVISEDGAIRKKISHKDNNNEK